jgi:hypothetical protein
MNETTPEVQVPRQYELKKIEKVKQSKLNTDISPVVCHALSLPYKSQWREHFEKIIYVLKISYSVAPNI